MLMAGLLCVIVMAVMVKMELGLLLFNSLSLLIICCIERSDKFKAFLFVCVCVCVFLINIQHAPLQVILHALLLTNLLVS